VAAPRRCHCHSRPDTTQRYKDDVELDDLAEALEKAAEARDPQASPDLATLETEIAKRLETLEWRRRESNPRKISIGLNGRRSAREQ
jgi:hypothetical protein